MTTYNAAITLDQIVEGAERKADTANALFAACSSSALWGIKTSVTSGLAFGLYGGNMNIAGVPTAIASQTLTLSASAINYIYATSAGVLTKTTSIPGSWPGPLAAGAVALYKLDVGTATIDSESANTVCYVLGLASQGATGPTGATGPAGTDLAATRKRMLQAVGGSVNLTAFGFDAFTVVAGTAVARTLAATSLRESIPYLGYETAGTSGASAQISHARNFCWLGNGTGLGGFTLAMRFCIEHTLNPNPATHRSFFGLLPSGTTVGNVEPDTLVSMIGFGSKAGDANLSIMNNDGSGSATMVGLGSNFPARATDNVYEIVLSTVANSGIVSYSITDVATGNVASGTLNSNIPATTTFLGPTMWVNNGATATKTSFGIMQIIGETRY